MFRIYGNPAVQRFLGREPKVVGSLEEMQSILEKRLELQKTWEPGKGAFALMRKDDERVVGTILCKDLPDGEGNPSGEVEIGWHLGEEDWGRGYATEAGTAVAEFGFRHLPNCPRLLAVVYPENVASQKVAERIGMKRIGRSTQYYGVELEVFELQRPVR